MHTRYEKDLFRLGAATGKNSTRAEAEEMIDGLLLTIRSLRDGSHQSPETERAIFSLQAAISGIRETMPRE